MYSADRTAQVPFDLHAQPLERTGTYALFFLKPHVYIYWSRHFHCNLRCFTFFLSCSKCRSKTDIFPALLQLKTFSNLIPGPSGQASWMIYMSWIILWYGKRSLAFRTQRLLHQGQALGLHPPMTISTYTEVLLSKMVSPYRRIMIGILSPFFVFDVLSFLTNICVLIGSFYLCLALFLWAGIAQATSVTSSLSFHQARNGLIWTELWTAQRRRRDMHTKQRRQLESCLYMEDMILNLVNIAAVFIMLKIHAVRQEPQEFTIRLI